jgi:hypothetical protein
MVKGREEVAEIIHNHKKMVSQDLENFKNLKFKDESSTQCAKLEFFKVKLLEALAGKNVYQAVAIIKVASESEGINLKNLHITHEDNRSEENNFSQDYYESLDHLAINSGLGDCMTEILGFCKALHLYPWE